MKNFILSVLLLTSIIAYSQDQTQIITKLVDGDLVGEKILSFEGKTAAEIYSASEKWVASTFRNTLAVSQSSIENEMIRIQGRSSNIFSFGMGAFSDLSYTIQIDIKEGRIRFKAYDLIVGSSTYPVASYIYKKNGDMRTSGQATKFNKITNDNLTLLLSSLKAIIDGKVVKDDDW